MRPTVTNTLSRDGRIGRQQFFGDKSLQPRSFIDILIISAAFRNGFRPSSRKALILYFIFLIIHCSCAHFYSRLFYRCVRPSKHSSISCFFCCVKERSPRPWHRSFRYYFIDMFVMGILHQRFANHKLPVVYIPQPPSLLFHGLGGFISGRSLFHSAGYGHACSCS